jgi:serine/threonine protein kinase
MSFPSRFGRYVLLERVNVGGMAEVFKAKAPPSTGFGGLLAIKRILPNYVEDDEFVRMFIDEARIAFQLNHPSIIRIHELGKHGEHYYISMEYVPSRDLRSILDRLRSNGQLMSIAQAAFITARVAEGLDYAHRRKDAQGAAMNIIHRDVSPQNVLVGFEGEVKVIDFGIAKAANRASKTQAGVLKGKFAYMSPEQVRGHPIDRRSDIFAVGVLLYEMLTGERLFIGESDFSTLERVRNAEVPPPSQFNKKISPSLENLVLKTLAREVEDRYQWASELAQELLPFTQDSAGPYSVRRLTSWMRDLYAAEVAEEESKLAEFLRINPDDVKERGAPVSGSILPLPQRTGQPPSPLAAGARNRPPPGYESSAIEPEDEESGEKTFVIESNSAQVPGFPSPGSPLATGRVGGPGGSASLASPSMGEEVEHSLYGGSVLSDEGDVRTSLSIGRKKSPAVGAGHSAGAGMVADAGRGPGPAGAWPGAFSSLHDAVAQSQLPPTRPSLARPPSQARPEPAVAAALDAHGGRSFDAVAAALAEEDPGAFDQVVQPVSAPPSAPWNGGNPGLPFGMLPRSNPSFPVVPPPAMDSASSTPLATPLPEYPAPQAATEQAPAFRPAEGVAPVRWAPVIAATSISAAAFVAALAFVALRAFGGSPGALELVAVPGQSPPSDMRIVLDGVALGASLPVRVPLESGDHTLSITGTGIVPIERAVSSRGELVRQPVALVAAVPDVVTVATRKPAVPPATGGWRLSLAAIEPGGAAVADADVLIDGVNLGRTPFEAELDPALSSVRLKVVKAGYAATELTVQRNARSAVGPGSVRLEPLPVGSASEPAQPSMPPSNADLATPAANVGSLGGQEAEANPVPPRAAADVNNAGRLGETKEERRAMPPPREVRPEPAKGATPESRASPSATVAEIELGTSPSAETTIDGRRYGATPFYGPKKLTLPVGTHRLEFFDKSANKKYRYQFKLKAPDPNNKIVIQFHRNDPPLVRGQVEIRKLD